ncbi:MAG: cytochrome P460 family protein [Ignavibacteria bacterium]|nr:cytochrome P460 family protein [Ignavibacteria bacterium]
MTIPTIRLFIVAVFCGAALTACSETTNPAPAEFIATDASFAGYAAWEKTTPERTGLDPASFLSGGAHDGTDTTVIRNMFVNKSGATRGTGGQFDNGVVFLKETKNADGTIKQILAMTKRGNDFNKDNGNWEWFMVGTDGIIIDRGANLMGGMCNACHSGAKTTDFVFTRS